MAALENYITPLPGYSFSCEDDVYAIMDTAFHARLADFLKRYHAIQQQENYPFLPTAFISKFPFVDHAPFKNEIFTRRQDLQLLEKIAQPYFSANKTALEIGGWNGWLTRYLSDKRMTVLSADIFPDINNGLRSKQFHAGANWLSLQTDVCDTRLYSKKFDLVVLNHCLQFYPEDTLQKYMALLAPGGMLVILGVSSFANDAIPAKKVKTARDYYQNKYGFRLHFYDGAGYFTRACVAHLYALSYTFVSYRFPVKGRLKHLLRSQKHGIFYYIKPA